jgi:hypothetical protein
MQTSIIRLIPIFYSIICCAAYAGNIDKSGNGSVCLQTMTSSENADVVYIKVVNNSATLITVNLINDELMARYEIWSQYKAIELISAPYYKTLENGAYFQPKKDKIEPKSTKVYRIMIDTLVARGGENAGTNRWREAFADRNCMFGCVDISLSEDQDVYFSRRCKIAIPTAK